LGKCRYFGVLMAYGGLQQVIISSSLLTFYCFWYAKTKHSMSLVAAHIQIIALTLWICFQWCTYHSFQNFFNRCLYRALTGCHEKLCTVLEDTILCQSHHVAGKTCISFISNGGSESLCTGQCQLDARAALPFLACCETSLLAEDILFLRFACSISYLEYLAQSVFNSKAVSEAQIEVSCRLLIS